MSPPDDRFLGLSRRARRFVIPVMAVALIFMVLGLVKGARGADRDGAAPRVGGDLHAVAELDARLFVSGHDGAAVQSPDRRWAPIPSLGGRDVMAWAAAGTSILAGGHEGLYRSSDNGSTFTKVPDVAVSDVHSLGAAGDVVYLASPQVGVLFSADGGKTFEPRGDAGRNFMGTIWVDPEDPDVAIAPSMQDGALKTTDGGASWRPLGGSAGSMAVAVDPSGQRIVVLRMDSAQASTDGGATWAAAEVPAGSRAGAYTADGHLVVAVLVEDRAEIFEENDGTWRALA